MKRVIDLSVRCDDCIWLFLIFTVYVHHSALHQNGSNDSALPNKTEMTTRAVKRKKKIEPTSFEPCLNIQNNFAQMFQILHSSQLLERFEPFTILSAGLKPNTHIFFYD